jgi:hypothetical protein
MSMTTDIPSAEHTTREQTLFADSLLGVVV